MKLKTTLVLLFVTIITFAQNNKSYTTFKANTLNNSRAYETTLNKTINFFTHNEVYVADLIDACLYLPNEKLKYKLCVKAYPNIIDKERFFKVYDTFSSLAYAMKLYHKTQAKELNQFEEVYEYPSTYMYQGLVKDNCSNYMSHSDFRAFVNDLHLTQNDTRNIRILKKAIYGHCLSTKQIMQLTEQLYNEESRYNFLQFAYDYAYDLENYPYSLQLLNSKRNKTSLAQFIQSEIEKLHTNNTSINNCYVEVSEFNYIIKTIKSENFRNEKLDIAKQHIAKNCLDLAQLKAIVKLFSFDDDKLNLLKYSFEYIQHNREYYQLRALLTFPNNKRSFDQFLLTKK